MTLCMLVEESMKPIPESIKVVQNYGSESVLLQNGLMVATGEVMLFEGSSEDFIAWLSGQEVWIGNGLMGFKKKKVKVKGPEVHHKNLKFFENEKEGAK